MKSIVALYFRISKRDEDMEEDIESNSIGNQRGILREYVKNHIRDSDMELREFIDDGFSGTSLNRPGIQELLLLAEKGMIYAIIVKDLSRFARNYFDAGNYLERIFPGMGVRFISVNDNYDSNRTSYQLPGIEMAFKGIMHDYYCKELSGKLKTARKQQVEKGKCIYAKPPYGYWKSDEEKGKLVVDQETAPIVKQIFERYSQGVSAYRIAKDLNQAGVETPNKRLERAGLIAFQDPEYSAHLCWSCGVVLSLLRNQTYLGDMIGNKEERIKICDKRCKRKDKEEWIVVAGTHEPIVGKELFQRVQRMLGEKKSPRKKDKDKTYYQIFKGKLLCRSCYGVMTKGSEHKGVAYYSCARCRVAGRKVTTIHSDFLEKEILEKLPYHHSVSPDYVLEYISESAAETSGLSDGEQLSQGIVNHYIDKILVYNKNKIQIMWHDEKQQKAK